MALLDFTHYGFSKSVKECYINFYHEPGVIDDLAKILISQGDLKLYFNKIKVELLDFGYHNWSDFNKLRRISLADFKFQHDIQIIINEFLASNSFSLIREKYNFNEEDNEYMIKIIYFIFTRDNFKNIAKKIIGVSKGEWYIFFPTSNRISDFTYSPYS
jgi:hypothetical protein